MSTSLFEMAKQAMEMRSQMKKMKKETDALRGESEGAGVKVIVRGDMTVHSIKIDPEVAELDKLPKLERAIVSNCNKALQDVQAQMGAVMSKITDKSNLGALLRELK